MVNTSQSHEAGQSLDKERQIVGHHEAEKLARITRLYAEKPGLQTEIERITNPEIGIKERFDLVDEFDSRHAEGREGMPKTFRLHTNDSYITLQVFYNGSMSIRISRK